MMRTDREIILSVLKLTQKGVAQQDHVAKDSHTPIDIANEVLRKLHEKSLIELNGNSLTTAPSQRLELAIEAIKQGADPQRTCRFLEWKEFENITAAAFKANGYTVKKNVHFKATDSKRWEIDLIACKQPRIICADCKHWQRGWSRAAIEKAVDAQVERTRALAESLQKFTDTLELNEWASATLIPIVIALTTNTLKIYNNTPIVPVLQLQNLINELPAQTTLLTHFSTIIKEKSRKLTEF
jgi:Holliday junction resolvase-like predicted endonuclease/predicted transcriptional regulator